jgi:hypothetical protein
MSYKGIREEGYAQESLAKQQAGLYEGQAAREKEVGLENLRDMREEEDFTSKGRKGGGENRNRQRLGCREENLAYPPQEQGEIRKPGGRQNPRT